MKVMSYELGKLRSKLKYIKDGSHLSLYTSTLCNTNSQTLREWYRERLLRDCDSLNFFPLSGDESKALLHLLLSLISLSDLTAPRFISC